MDWKQKLKWKIIIILLAAVGIMVIWAANKAGSRRYESYQEKKLYKEMLHENELAGAKVNGVPLFDVDQTAEDTSSEQQQSAAEETNADNNTIQTAEVPQISVLLMDGNYKSYYHSQIQLKFQGNYQVSGSENQTFEDGSELTILADSPLMADGSLTISPTQKECRAVLLSLARGQGNPAYRGSFTIYKDENGLRIVNTLPLEEYLYGVVPSEMPSSYPLEALKAQAVCARTYAIVQMQDSKLEDLGAQVDDSVSFQVYQNNGEAEASNQAVTETSGQILLHDGTPITAYYFSTSHGKTSTDEVWEVSAPSSYLKSVSCEYDANEPWYHWTVKMSLGQLLQNIQKTDPLVQAVGGMAIHQTGEGDAVLQLNVATDQGEKAFFNEYTIRSVLSPAGLSITRQDGSVVKGSSLLPSSYFTIEEQRDTDGSLTGYLISGGGYGHGVGLSQNGAKGMADQGTNYQDILTFFYQNIAIGNVDSIG